MSDIVDKRKTANGNLRAMLDAKKRGDLITASEIVDATGFDDWRSFGRIVRAWAPTKRFAITPVRGDGWRVEAPDGHATQAGNYRKSALRKIKRAVQIHVHAPVAEMSEAATRKLLFEGPKLANQLALMESDDKDIRKEFKLGPERNPRLIAS